MFDHNFYNDAVDLLWRTCADTGGTWKKRTYRNFNNRIEIKWKYSCLMRIDLTLNKSHTNKLLRFLFLSHSLSSYPLSLSIYPSRSPSPSLSDRYLCLAGSWIQWSALPPSSSPIVQFHTRPTPSAMYTDRWSLKNEARKIFLSHSGSNPPVFWKSTIEASYNAYFESINSVLSTSSVRMVNTLLG